jgi:hypothetical protein
MTDSAERLVRRALLDLALGERVFQRIDLGHQRGGLRLVLGGLGLANLLGRRVAPLLRLLQARHDLAPSFVQFKKLRCELHVAARRDAALLQAGVEHLRVVAYPFDVEHGADLSLQPSSRVVIPA